MPPVIREQGFAFRIYTRDHPPAHVRVRQGGNSLVIEFEDSIEIRRNDGVTTRDVAAAKLIVANNLELLRAEWRRIHG